MKFGGRPLEQNDICPLRPRPVFVFACALGYSLPQWPQQGTVDAPQLGAKVDRSTTTFFFQQLLQGYHHSTGQSEAECRSVQCGESLQDVKSRVLLALGDEAQAQVHGIYRKKKDILILLGFIRLSR
ncbi:hypothetical protein EYF80_025436 [Liparis tanakae]|uniref:Uncharacterized protein n=1 Tax=Liparis tanakae TaxID=230148 RepID=A0A4Z2HF25_9TELE|nr:hypothetical protein EYF80_025436 [Liparis tanakae]